MEIFKRSTPMPHRLYTAPGGSTIVYHYPFNFNGTNYIFVCLDDGTAVAVNSDTGAITTVTTQPGAFYPQFH